MTLEEWCKQIEEFEKDYPTPFVDEFRSMIADWQVDKNKLRQEHNIALQERDSIITEQRKLIDDLEEYNNKLKDKLGDSSNFQGNR